MTPICFVNASPAASCCLIIDSRSPNLPLTLISALPTSPTLPAALNTAGSKLFKNVSPPCSKILANCAVDICPSLNARTLSNKPSVVPTNVCSNSPNGNPVAKIFFTALPSAGLILSRPAVKICSWSALVFSSPCKKVENTASAFCALTEASNCSRCMPVSFAT